MSLIGSVEKCATCPSGDYGIISFNDWLGNKVITSVDNSVVNMRRS